MNTLRNPYIWLATIICALIVAASPGCKSPERAMLATAQASNLTAKNALARWNQYLGTERTRIATMTPEAAAERIAQLQGQERRVMQAVDEYNRAVSAARIAVNGYFDIKAGLTATNAPPTKTDQVAAYLAAITTAENALINLITTYAK